LTSPDPKRHRDSSLVPASQDAGRTAVESASGEQHATLSFAPGLFYARTSSSTRAGSAVDTAGLSTSKCRSSQPPVSLSASSSQPEGSSGSSFSEAVLSREMSSSEGTRYLSSSEPVTQSLEPTQTQSSNLPTTAASSQDSSGAASSSRVSQPGTSSADEIEDSLQCVICQEILYKCVRYVASDLVGLRSSLSDVNFTL